MKKDGERKGIINKRTLVVSSSTYTLTGVVCTVLMMIIFTETFLLLEWNFMAGLGRNFTVCEITNFHLKRKRCWFFFNG